MSYRGFDKSDRIQNLWVMSLPNATPETVGVSTASQRDTALEGHGLPWMMLPGTPGAHIMIPINPTAKTSTITDEAADEITQATLPLPEDLRAGAAVYKYDPKTGERIVLRKGTNSLECTPRGDDGFTWCYNKVSAPRRDFSAKLRAQGKAEKEIQTPSPRPPRTARSSRRRSARCRTACTARRIASSCCGCCRCRARRPKRSACRRQPARRGDRRRRPAVADAGRHARRAHHDSDQQVIARLTPSRYAAVPRGTG